MKFNKSISICWVIITVFLSALPGHTQDVTNDNLHAHKRLLEFEDSMVIASFLLLSKDAHEEYLKKYKVEPQITCKKCTTKLLNLYELEVGLFAWALKVGAENTVNFEKIKLTLYDCLKVVSERSSSEVIDYMVRISNETKQLCSDCHSRSDSWDKVV